MQQKTVYIETYGCSANQNNSEILAGILTQDAFGLAIWVWLVFVGVCAATTVILYVVYRGKEEQLPNVLAYTALVCFVCLGAVRLTSYEQPVNNDIRNLVAEERKLATIRGSVITNKVWTWSWVNGAGQTVSGYQNTEAYYEPALIYNPPPYFPSSGDLQFISWEESPL